MTAKLTDHAVSELPLEAGRAELLEEIMSTVAPERQAAEPQPPTRHRARWLAPVAAAAVIAAIASSPLWWQAPGDDPGSGGTTSAAAQPDESGFRAVLDAPGWTVTATESGDDGSGEVNYDRDGGFTESGGASFTITWYPADSYDSYVEDREHIVDPPAPGEPVEVLGLGGQLWAYSDDDHTVIREVQDGHWMELRGTGMDEAAYRALLGQVRLVDRPGFEAALPEDHVGRDEREVVAGQILADIEAVSGAGFPGGDAPSFADGEAKDRYQFGAEVVGAYTCAWLESFENAQAHDQADQAQRALGVLATSRDWAILDEMDATGDYPEVLWQIADEAAAGELQPWYREGLGC